MKQQPIPWTLVYTDAPKGLDSAFGKIRIYMSPNQKTLEIQANEDGINSCFEYGWLAWIIRVEYNDKKGWQIKKDSYTGSAEKVYKVLYNADEDAMKEMPIEGMHYSIVTYAIQKKDRYLMDCLFDDLGVSIENQPLDRG